MIRRWVEADAAQGLEGALQQSVRALGKMVDAPDHLVECLVVLGEFTALRFLDRKPSSGKTLLAASATSGIHVWDTADGTQLASWASSDTLTLTGLDLPDGRTLLASGGAGGVLIWDPWTGDLRHTLLTGAPVPALTTATGPEGTVLHLYGAAGLATVLVDERQL